MKSKDLIGQKVQFDRGYVNISQFLHEGSAKDVYFGTTQQARPIAVKAVPFYNQAIRETFRRELWSLNQLSNSQYIITFYDHGLHAGTPDTGLLLFEYCERGSLMTNISNSGITEEEVERIIQKILYALLELKE